MEPSRNVVEGYYSDVESPSVPVIPLKVYTPTGKKSLVVEAKVDTGFSGPLLLSIEEYLKLGLQLYERAENVAGLVAGGLRIELRVSRAIVELGQLRVPCDVYTTVFAKRSLLGRELLNRFKTLLDAPKGIVTVEA